MEKNITSSSPPYCSSSALLTSSFVTRSSSNLNLRATKHGVLHLTNQWKYQEIFGESLTEGNQSYLTTYQKTWMIFNHSSSKNPQLTSFTNDKNLEPIKTQHWKKSPGKNEDKRSNTAKIVFPFNWKKRGEGGRGEDLLCYHLSIVA